MAKFNLKFISKLKWDKQYLFILMATVMLAVLIALIAWSLVFLISNFTNALSEPVTPKTVLRFDIEGFEQLNLIR